MEEIDELQDEAGWSDSELKEMILQWVETYCHGASLVAYLQRARKDNEND